MPATSAAQIGLPIAQLIVATNRNDILARFFATGRYSAGEVHPTIEPEHGHPGGQQLRAPAVRPVRSGRRAGAPPDGRFRRSAASSRSPADALGRARELFDAASAGEEETAATMARGVPGDRRAGRSAHRRGHPGRAAMPARSRRRPWCALRPRTRQNFPRRSQARDWRHGRSCRRASPTYIERAERFDVLPNELGAVKAHIQQLPSMARA